MTSHTDVPSGIVTWCTGPASRSREPMPCGSAAYAAAISLMAAIIPSRRTRGGPAADLEQVWLRRCSGLGRPSNGLRPDRNQAPISSRSCRSAVAGGLSRQIV
ncbi:hypothetical protein GCM10023205_65980 [Yinghuangia aomiensis]|uniref:Uncharacterized protein n=1 Tax=Yinghuangia aomiensis TaxID=676205 RepID=A0ABP9I2P6_9ACTN